MSTISKKTKSFGSCGPPELAVERGTEREPWRGDRTQDSLAWCRVNGACPVKIPVLSREIRYSFGFPSWSVVLFVGMLSGVLKGHLPNER